VQLSKSAELLHIEQAIFKPDFYRSSLKQMIQNKEFQFYKTIIPYKTMGQKHSPIITKEKVNKR